MSHPQGQKKKKAKKTQFTALYKKYFSCVVSRAFY